MSGARQPELSAWQQQLVAELHELAKTQPGVLSVVEPAQVDDHGMASIKVRINLRDVPQRPPGLRLREDEDFLIRLPTSAFEPPTVDVEHTRFLGFPHVLQGQRLCIYLDPGREWHPRYGIVDILNRLWDWLLEAAAGRFNAATAMYHAVGGVLHRAANMPTLVVREAGPGRAHQLASVIERGSKRYDLTYARDRGGLRTPVLRLTSDLPFGAATTFSVLEMLLDDPYLDRRDGRAPRVMPQSPTFVTSLLAAVVRNAADTEQYFVLAVPHPADGPDHLLGGRVSATTANALRDLARGRGILTGIDVSEVTSDVMIEWCNMSDERPEVTRRRDDERPVNGFRGKSVHIWGCGGLGSWIAEFIARAGAGSITVCDSGTITGGLLVRQNFTEADIGHTKAESLAQRLRAIRDDLSVDVSPGFIPGEKSSYLNADVIIDATVTNHMTVLLDELSAEPDRAALIVQVATDSASGTLGIATMCPPQSTSTPSALDEEAGRVALDDGGLELYHGLWQQPVEGDELIPTRGCSVPTFHGSAADLAGVAAALVSVIGPHLVAANAAIAGTHLVALPHAACGPRHRFIAAQADHAGPSSPRGQ